VPISRQKIYNFKNRHTPAPFSACVADKGLTDAGGVCVADAGVTDAEKIVLTLPLPPSIFLYVLQIQDLAGGTPRMYCKQRT
jgi:hypothetical protein